MIDYDPVPPQHLLTAEQAEMYIPSRFIGDPGADVTPREFALQLLVDDSPGGRAEIGMFQRSAEGDVSEFFRFLNTTLHAGVGRHVQRVLMVMALHPARDSMINVVDAGTAYLEASSRAYDDIIGNKVLLTAMAIEAGYNLEENIKRVQLGDVNIPA